VKFVICDVFTEQAFGGNQLAVFPDARGLAEGAMQALAREFNFAETTFVLPPQDPRHFRRVRIFTPKVELPFAGHPTVGTAAVLATLGLSSTNEVVLEEGIGPVVVELELGGRAPFARLVLEKEAESPPDTPARAAVDRASLDRAAWSEHFARAWASSLYLFAGERAPGSRLYARMFAPAYGIEEDAASGSACAALAGRLAGRLSEREGTFTWRIDQGVAMGRPSLIEASAEKRAGRIARLKVGGYSVIVGEGNMRT